MQGTTPRIDEPLVPSPNLNEMNVEELDKESKRAIKLWQLTIFHPFQSEVVSFNVSVIEKEKRAKEKKITEEPALPFCVGRCSRKK